ncbi:unnamed protein product [Mesocestoides corti]|uniref:LRRCT domain-containing protein n=1 Tax=Mesocestoides corti TaxID=53468 RepID=A0A0R3U9Y0_MESCO|nr:unnamed protein product [Mesocestoides corti]
MLNTEHAMFWIILILLLVTFRDTRAVCRIEDTKCWCVEMDPPSESLSNILVYCCQSDVFHVYINGSELVGGSVFYHKPCHNLIDFRIHAPTQSNLPPNGLAFNGLPNLESLHITGDRSLGALPDGVFAGLGASLRQLNLSANALTALTGAEFAGLGSQNSRLDEVDLSNNRMRDLAAGCFQAFRRVRRLNLEGNLIAELRPDVFTGLEFLEELNLRSNPIDVIIGGTFGSLSKLRKLFISGVGSTTSLAALTPGMLYGLHALRQLEFSNLGIATINVETFMEMRQLQELDLSGNLLTEVPQLAFKRMVLAQRTARFQRLNLSNNRIICLPDGSFSDFPQLKYLDLSGNLLTVIGDQAFRGVRHMRDLNLLDNPLSVIIPSAFDEFTVVDGAGFRSALNIIHRHRQPGEMLLQNTVVRLPQDEKIVGMNKLRLRAVYGRQNEPVDSPIAIFADLRCPSLPLPNHISLKHSTLNVKNPVEEKAVSGLGGFLSENKILIIVVVICAGLTLIVTSATILSCQSCRKRRLRRKNNKNQIDEGVVTSPPESETGRSHFSAPSKQNTFSYNSLEVASAAYSEQIPVSMEKMSTSERLFNLGQKVAPPPYPHNLQTMEERLRQVAATVAVPMFGAYSTSDSPHHPHSGQSSPSNLGSSPRFSSSASSVQQHRLNPPPALHLVMTGSTIEGNKPPPPNPPPPGSASPLHESGIVSDNASSSLVTALGVL